MSEEKMFAHLAIPGKYTWQGQARPFHVHSVTPSDSPDVYFVEWHWEGDDKTTRAPVHRNEMWPITLVKAKDFIIQEASHLETS